MYNIVNKTNKKIFGVWSLLAVLFFAFGHTFVIPVPSVHAHDSEHIDHIPHDSDSNEHTLCLDEFHDPVVRSLPAEQFFADIGGEIDHDQLTPLDLHAVKTNNYLDHRLLYKYIQQEIPPRLPMHLKVCLRL